MSRKRRKSLAKTSGDSESDRKFRTTDEMKAKTRERLVEKGIVILCKTPKCNAGSDTTTLNSEGLCHECVAERHRQDERDLQRLASSSETYNNEGLYS